jgi:hypothetical protein
MRVGWLQFGRNAGTPTTGVPDNAVTAPRPWLLCAAIVASTAALLGTSPDPGDELKHTTYTFERQGIDGGFVELTRDRPTATFFVTVHADALGPEGVITTDRAAVNLDASISATGLAEGATAPFVSVKVSSPDAAGFAEKTVLDGLKLNQELVFTGDCDTPPGSKACKARFTVQVARDDDGAGDGVVRFDWFFDAFSSAEKTSTATGMVGPLDPPWTIEVTQP